MVVDPIGFDQKGVESIRVVIVVVVVAVVIPQPVELEYGLDLGQR